MRQAFILLALHLIFSSTALGQTAAQQPEKFGATGSVVLGGGVSLSITNNAAPGNGLPSTSTYSARLSPGVDYFVIENLAIGASLNGSFLSYTDQGLKTVQVKNLNTGLQLATAYNLMLSDRLSLWSRVFVGYGLAQVKINGGPYGDHVTTWTAGLFVPLLFHVAPRYFVGGGPEIYDEWGTFENRLTVAVQTVLGGWF